MAYPCWQFFQFLFQWCHSPAQFGTAPTPKCSKAILHQYSSVHWLSIAQVLCLLEPVSVHVYTKCADFSFSIQLQTQRCHWWPLVFFKSNDWSWGSQKIGIDGAVTLFSLLRSVTWRPSMRRTVECGRFPKFIWSNARCYSHRGRLQTSGRKHAVEGQGKQNARATWPLDDICTCCPRLGVISNGCSSRSSSNPANNHHFDSKTD